MRPFDLMGADILVLDSTGEAVIWVQVKAYKRTDDQVKQDIAYYAERERLDVPYLLFVDLAKIRLFQWDGADAALLDVIPTATVLRTYGSEFDTKRISEHFLSTRVDAWLQDIAYHWKCANPPAIDRLRKSGIADRINRGSTVPGGVLAA